MLLTEDVAMKTFDFSPFYRSTIGFDHLFEMLDSAGRPDWPPYNIEKTGENDYRITMAVAGFGSQEVELTQHGNTLIVAGQKTDQPRTELLHQGIAFRNFNQTFNLADYVKVKAATLENGLLSIDLIREVPEQLKPRRIPVGVGQAIALQQGKQQEKASQPTLQGVKAA
jgi:molecular chaperone IbpA